MDNAAVAKRPPRRWLWPLARLVLVGIALELVFMLAVFLVGQSMWSAVPVASDAIIVLGARVYPSGRLSPTLQFRVDRAKQLFDQGQARYIVVCGAQGRDERRPEADSMAEYLIEAGVPENRILRDPDSFDTVQNLRNAQSLMAGHDLATAIVVTSDYHLTRSLWIAREVGLDACGAAAPGPDSAYKFVEAHFRETVSWVNHFTGGFVEKLVGRGGR